MRGRKEAGMRGEERRGEGRGEEGEEFSSAAAEEELQ